MPAPSSVTVKTTRSPSRATLELDAAAARAGVAGVEQQVDERLLEQRDVAGDRAAGRASTSACERDARGGEAVLDELDARPRATAPGGVSPSAGAPAPHERRGRPRMIAPDALALVEDGAAPRARRARRPPPWATSCSARPAMTPSGVETSWAMPVASAPRVAARLAVAAPRRARARARRGRARARGEARAAAGRAPPCRRRRRARRRRARPAPAGARRAARGSGPARRW